MVSLKSSFQLQNSVPLAGIEHKFFWNRTKAQQAMHVYNNCLNQKFSASVHKKTNKIHKKNSIFAWWEKAFFIRA